MLDDRQYMRTPYRPGWSMTTILLFSLGACYVVQLLLEGVKGLDWVNRYLALSSVGIAHGLIYQLLTFQFLHGSVMHLLFNMIGLYFFGRAVEEILGSAGMLKLYLVSGMVGGLLQVGLAFALPQYFRGGVVGASAGVFGLVAAFATHAPDQPITMLIMFILPVTFKLKVFLLIEAVVSVVGLLGPLVPSPYFQASNVAHAAHLGGMFTGMAWIRWGRMPGAPFNFWRGFAESVRPKREAARPTAKRNSKGAVNKQEELPPAEFISREVDPILEKISAHGIQSLTARERQILEAARSKMARR
jgi:membrane associated rhomboid family serine protease